MGKYIIIILLQISIVLGCPGQSVDSLLKILEQEKHQTEKINLLMQIAGQYYSNKEGENAKRYIEKAFQEIKLVDSVDYRVDNINRLGVILRNNSLYPEALKMHNYALDLAANNSYERGRAISLNNIGVVYRRQDNHAKAAEFHTMALRVAEQIKDTFSISVSTNSLGNIYSLNGRYKEAIEYFTRALELSIQQKNLLGQAINYNNIGEVYEFTNDYNSAETYYTKSQQINQAIKNEKGIAISYNALGKINLYKGNYKQAQELFEKALVLDEKIGDKKFITESHLNIGRAHIKQSQHQSAIYHLNTTIQLASEIRSYIHLQAAYEELSGIYSFQRKYEQALNYYRNAARYKDSLLNEKNTRQISTIQAIFDSEKKENQIRILEEEKAKEAKRQRIISISLIIGLSFSLVVIVLIYHAFRSKRSANILLSNQNVEIEKKNQVLNYQKDEIQKQKEEIEKHRLNIELKNKNLEEAYQIIENYIGKITDSIRYAEKIQKSIFPDTDVLKGFFKEHFILYSPKDIVSGDFYWFSIKKETIYFAIADCTGHGVPGAFMSIIGIDLLNQAINQQGFEDTAEILAFLNTELRRRLKRDKEEVVLKDSMDISLCAFNKSTGEIVYSGALIPLFLYRNNTFDILKPDNTALGVSTALFSRDFNKQKTHVKPGDFIYLSTDGYLDQFGGEQNKKFMRSKFFNLITKVKELPAEMQKEEFERAFINWKGKNEQIDDVLVWGIKV